MSEFKVVVEGPCVHGATAKHHPAHGSCPGAVIGEDIFCGRGDIVCEGVERFAVPGPIFVGPLKGLHGEDGWWVRPDDFAAAVVNIERGTINVPEEI